MTTKLKILQEAMKLFSIQGFHAVSIRAIAKEVGVESSALYKHYSSKQAIFDAIVKEAEERFLEKYSKLQISDVKTPKDLEDLCMTMFLYQTKDPWVVMFRRILIIEMFNNEQAAGIFKRIFVDLPIKNQKNVFDLLIAQGKISDANSEVMSMELYSPFFLYHIVPDELVRVGPLLRQHVNNFAKNYMILRRE